MMSLEGIAARYPVNANFGTDFGANPGADSGNGRLVSH